MGLHGGRNFPVTGLEKALKHLRHPVVLFESAIEHPGKHRFGDIVMGRAQAAGGNHNIDPVHRLPDHGPYRRFIVPDGGDSGNIDSNGLQAFAEKARITVLNQSADHFIADGDDLRLPDSRFFRKQVSSLINSLFRQPKFP